MKVSVMITTYNLEKYIARALDSVLMQDEDFQILVGDDGSDDDTVRIIRQYQKKYPDIIQLFSMPRTAGEKYDKIERAAANRMNLWAHAGGEYCCFLDGDDYYTDSHRLKKMTAVLDDSANADCIMCAHNLLIHEEDTGAESVLCSAKRKRKLSVKDYWPLMFIQANGLMFRNIYRTHKPEGAIEKRFDDNIITFYLFSLGKMYYLPECMGAYSQVSTSTWHEADELSKAIINFCEIALELEISPKSKKYILARHYKDIYYLAKQNINLSGEDTTLVLKYLPDSLWYYCLAKIKRVILKIFKLY